jgi:hypothetical protein
MNGIPAETDRVVYANCMEEIKRRTEAIYAILRGQCSTLYPITNIEFICLQIRKILELIALASLASHKEEFAKQHQKFAEMWRAKKILEDLAQLNPGFYPVPTEQVLDQKTGKVLEVRSITKPFLTKVDFVDVYQQCSAILHAENPYGMPKQLPEVEAGIPIWMEKIKNLLNHHHVQLFSSKHQLWVVMKAKTDGRVHVHLFERIDDPVRVAALHEQRRKATSVQEDSSKT